MLSDNAKLFKLYPVVEKLEKVLNLQKLTRNSETFKVSIHLAQG